MCTSATERAARLAAAYVTASVAVAAFGAVYELFSHGVWSGWMVYAFLFPLVLGALPFSVAAVMKRRLPGTWALRLQHAAVATLTVGSVMEGVLAIYGTTNGLTAVYWIVGGALLTGSVVLRIVASARQD